jgi:hypothetical protein
LPAIESSKRKKEQEPTTPWAKLLSQCSQDYISNFLLSLCVYVSVSIPSSPILIVMLKPLVFLLTIYIFALQVLTLEATSIK